MAVLAQVFVERDTQAGDPGVGFEASGLFACAETQLGSDATTTQKKIERHGLFETVGAKKKMTRSGGLQAGYLEGLRQECGVGRRGMFGGG